ncbi:MAG: GNAT family N-acetyltransferase [Anaerolineales bacterium]|nr:GNAT family N-acetyltransferase [Anaerolineales bacterium]MCB8938177.1 GNAT family N-acetyltransferase [Ardenticatenaceae bacterium]
MTIAQTAITYRPAQASDEAAIKALIRAVNINPIGLKWPRFLVAVDENGRLIGCGQIKPHRDGSRELASIAVQKAWRRQGIAKEIIERLLADEAPPVWLTCMNKLVPFYEQFGFVEMLGGDGCSLPRYFRLATLFFKPIQKLSRIPGYLAVMVR